MTTADNIAVITMLLIVLVIFSVIVLQSMKRIPKKKWATFVVITLISVFSFIIAIAFT